MKLITGIRLLYQALTSLSEGEKARYILAEKITEFIYPRYRFSEFGRIFLEDADFLAYYERFEGRTNYHSLDRKYTLDQLLKLMAHVPGDTAECGAYKGASSYLICHRNRGDGRQHHVFDSFAGLSAPGSQDGTYWQNGDLATSEDIIRSNLHEFDFVYYHAGWIPDRFPEVANRRFAFVHIDVDLYQPTLDSLEFFYDRLSPGAIIVCDDYGFTSCPGARKAMDEFFQGKSEEVVSLTTGQAFVIKRGDA
jgi:hypothetical protein